ncbi:MAG: 16S rRNA (cytosine(1402)-N(4))-methyltransferase RsmH [Limnochordales bacterium]|nr:MAG: 16S rRNA (cytosine(1402)-N(4))-methyltransferase [Bacillota bacterium]
MAEFEHVPVMLHEVLRLLDPQPGQIFVDGTVGGGGHALRIARAVTPGGRLIAIDRDASALERAKSTLSDFRDAVTFVHDDFRHLRRILADLGVSGVHGVLLDLGVSSFQLDEPRRGFTYRFDAPLDMRMDTRSRVTAADLVNSLSFDELTRIFREYGEERWARRIAREIVRRREREPFITTGQLVEAVKDAIPAPARRRGPHPAKRTFQALRIAVNDELAAVREGLEAAIDALLPGGRVAVISFHSLEDRIVKQTFARLSQGCQCPPDVPVCRCGKKPLLRILTRKAVVPGAAELEKNPRARSARLRVAERTGLGREGGE